MKARCTRRGEDTEQSGGNAAEQRRGHRLELCARRAGESGQPVHRGIPGGEGAETGVACKNTKADRVIVTISYELNGKNGDYGFDYEKDENGEYVLKRYGGGVSSDDL